MVYMVLICFKLSLNMSPRPSTIMLFEVWNILKKDKSRLMASNNLHNIPKELAVYTMLEALLTPSLGEGLARESSAQNIMRGYFSNRNILNVACGQKAKIIVVNST